MEWLTHRPLAVFSFAFVFGALMEAVVGGGKELAVAAAFSGLLSALAGFVAARYLLLWLAITAYLGGFAVTRYRLPEAPFSLSVPFEGIVAQSPLPIQNGYRLVLQVRQNFNKKSDSKMFVQLAVLTEDPFYVPPWKVGDAVRVHRFWGRPTQQRRYRFQRIFWIGRTRPEALEPLGTTHSFPIIRWREKWRQIVIERWTRSLPEREQTTTFAALSSIVFGVRTIAMSYADEQAFARSGLAHLFVPSGSQVTLLMGIAWLAHRYFQLPPFPLLVLLLCFYLPLTRGEPSIYRAVLMGLYAFVGWRWYLDIDWPTSLWLSSAVLVAVEPAMLHDVGFQLSYAATFGLIHASPLLERWFYWLPLWLRFPLSATLSAQLFLTPILAHYFGRISLIAPLANLCAVLPASFALTFGFLSAFLSLLSPWAAMPLSIVAGELAKLVVQMAHWFAAPSWASLLVPYPTGWQTLLLLFCLAVLVAWLGQNSAKSGAETPVH